MSQAKKCDACGDLYKITPLKEVSVWSEDTFPRKFGVSLMVTFVAIDEEADFCDKCLAQGIRVLMVLFGIEEEHD